MVKSLIGLIVVVAALFGSTALAPGAAASAASSEHSAHFLIASSAVGAQAHRENFSVLHRGNEPKLARDMNKITIPVQFRAGMKIQ